MSISTSYLSNLYSNYSSILLNSTSSSSSSSTSSLISKLMGTDSDSSSSDMTSIVSRYTYFKANYKEIKASLTESDTDDDETTSSTDSTETTATSTTRSYITTKLNAGDLKDSIEDLQSESLYTKDSDGNYNTDNILEKVKEFTESYNNLKELSSESTNETVVKQAYYMVNTTTSFKSILSKVGIEVNSDNTLSVDEDTFKSSDMSTVKALFNGNSSYGGQVSKRASEIKSAPVSGYLTYTNTTSSSDSSSILTSYLSNYNTTSLLDYFV